MRKLLVSLTASILVAACSKSGPADNGCIARTFINRTDPGLTPSQVHTADSLFTVNNIDHSNFRYYWMGEDTFHMLNPPYTFINEIMVRVDQYTNGLRIFNEDIAFDFQNGIFSYQSGNLTKGTHLDTVPSLSLARLRQLFTNDLRSHPANTTHGLTDSCYKAEFGYYNLSTDFLPSENLVKAWLVTLTSAKYPDYYPAGIYRDDNGKSIVFVGNIIYMDPITIN